MHVDVPRLLVALGITDFRDQGGEVWAPCPYPGHDEKTPSWSMTIDPHDSLRNGFNHCFGCGSEGGPVHLVAERIGLSGYAAAIHWIRDKGLDMEVSLPMRAEVTMTGYSKEAFRYPPGIAEKPLQRWNSVARGYLAKRGITDEQAARWRLAIGEFGRARQRIVFPVYNRDGELLNWTARAYAGQDRGLDPEPRYRHPNHSEGADNGAIFGEQHWDIRPARDTLVVTEGAINALACERAGAQYVGALSGSQFDPGQLMKLAQFQRILLAVDMDVAGSKIAHALTTSLARWKKVQRVQFPGRDDPADIAARDLDELSELLQWSDA